MPEYPDDARQIREHAPVAQRRFPEAIRGVPLRTLVGWYADIGTAPSPEIRELLRDRTVRAAIAELLRAERARERNRW